LEKAKLAHENWVKALNQITEEMKIYPLQTDSKRCAFGHFYHSIRVDHPEIAKDWNAINGVHHELHNMGMKVIEAVRKGDQVSAQTLFREAEQLSKQVIGHINQTVHALESLSKRGVEALKS